MGGRGRFTGARFKGKAVCVYHQLPDGCQRMVARDAPVCGAPLTRCETVPPGAPAGAISYRCPAGHVTYVRADAPEEG